jgi:hypothetical protein
MPEKKSLIQRVEIRTDDYPVHCPFCGAKAIAGGDSEEVITEFCEHVLFMGHDEGFEYRSARFNSLIGDSETDQNDIDPGDKGVDGYTDKIELVDSVKFAIYQPAPSFFGAYIGFAPVHKQ